jgi:hypothetical protein
MIPGAAYLYWTEPLFASALGALIMVLNFAIALIFFLSIKIKIEEVKALHLRVDVASRDDGSPWSQLRTATYAIVGKVLSTTTQFDAVFLGKVVRVAALISLAEFLFALALAMLWIPSNARCWAESTVTGSLMVMGGIALWTCIQAVFWKHFAQLISDFRGTGDSPPESTGWVAFYSVRPNTALYTAIFVGFAASGLVPIAIIIRECGP